LISGIKIAKNATGKNISMVLRAAQRLKLAVFIFSTLFVLGLALPEARADLLYTGSQDGKCCFNVDLAQVTTTDVLVTVTLTGGAEYFVNTGGGHPGFAFSISGDPSISIINISSPWDSTDIHTTSFATNGPDLGTFDYNIDNPGSGANDHNPGPLSFDVTVSSGTLSIGDFTTSSNGKDYFVADIQDSSGNTGLSGITSPPKEFTPTNVPEPASVLLLGTVLFGVCTSIRKRWSKQS
jgi:hypothetical protein